MTRILALALLLVLSPLHAGADDRFPAPVPAEDPPTGGPTGSEAPTSVPFGTDPAPRTAARVLVPALMGLSMTDAQRRLVDARLQPRPWFVDGAGAAPYSVVNQKLAAGSEVQAGTAVDFRVARPAVRTDRVPVPHLLGLSREEAVMVLRGLGVEGMILSRKPGEFQGRVVRQDPEPGAWMQWDQYLTFTMSGEGADVPLAGEVVVAGTMVKPLVGVSVAEAEQALRTIGLKPHAVRRLDPDAEQGYVSEQSPQAGSTVAPGSTVTLYVPQDALVPDLRGLTLEQSEIALSAAGLRSRFDPRPVGSERQRVTAQRPTAAQRVTAGSSVVLLFDGDAAGGGPNWRMPDAPFGAVPDVLGQPPEQAQARLKHAGFESVLEWAPGVANTDSVRVAGQRFPPGARRRMGTTVPLWIDLASAVPVAPVTAEEPGLMEKVGGFFRRIPGEVRKLPNEASKLPGVFERLGEEVKKLPGKVEDLVK